MSSLTARPLSHNKVCKRCGAPFHQDGPGKYEYCSIECSRAAGRYKHAARERRYRSESQGRPIVPMAQEIPCRKCGRMFVRSQPRQFLCSARCRSLADQERTERYQRKLFPVKESKCLGCGNQFSSSISRQTYCSAKCREARVTRKWLDGVRGLKLARISAGVLCELIVTADLYSRGWEIFKPFSHAACCDLIAIRGEDVLRMEVKAGYRIGNRQSRAKGTVRPNQKFDCLAIVCDDHDITYQPPLEQAFTRVIFKGSGLFHIRANDLNVAVSGNVHHSPDRRAVSRRTRKKPRT